MESKLRAIAVDDEFRALEVIERYAAKVPFLELIQTFSDPLEALSFLKDQSIDLIFLDINMPELSGTSFAKLIKKEVQVIFTTAYSEYAVEGFELEATDYLLKPIEFDRFLKACIKANDGHSVSSVSDTEGKKSPGQKIKIQTSGKLIQMDQNEFLFAEKLGNDMFLFLQNNRKLKCRISIKELLEQLPERCIQVHKSFIVSLDKIDLIEKNLIRIEDHEIPIGRVYKRGLVNKMR